MLTARCKICHKELASSSKVQFCGCPNQMRVVDDTIGAIDLDQVVLTNYNKKIKYTGILTNDDLKYQEERRQRKVRRINFEER
jgi:hypothetical protein